MTSPTPKRLNFPRRGRALTFTWNGQQLTGYEGESIAAALLANGVFALRRTARGEARGVFCGMGSCFECRVQVGDAASVTTVRACLTPVGEGMVVATHVEASADTPGPSPGAMVSG